MNALVQNIIASCSNIEILTAESWKFLYLSQGFFPHYTHAGFILEYSERSDLKHDLFYYESRNQYVNLKRTDKDFNRDSKKKIIYNHILKELRK